MDSLQLAAKGLIDEGQAVVETLRARAAREILDRIGEVSEDRFLDIAALAAHICDTPIAAVSLIDDDTAFYKALLYPGEVTMTACGRDSVICNLLTRTPDQPLILYDLPSDRRVSGLPFVDGTYDYIKFYMGLPLTTTEGYVVGTICVADRVVRKKIRGDQQAALERLRKLTLTLMGEL